MFGACRETCIDHRDGHAETQVIAAGVDAQTGRDGLWVVGRVHRLLHQEGVFGGDASGVLLRQSAQDVGDVGVGLTVVDTHVLEWCAVLDAGEEAIVLEQPVQLVHLVVSEGPREPLPQIGVLFELLLGSQPGDVSERGDDDTADVQDLVQGVGTFGVDIAPLWPARNAGRRRQDVVEEFPTTKLASICHVSPPMLVERRERGAQSWTAPSARHHWLSLAIDAAGGAARGIVPHLPLSTAPRAGPPRRTQRG